VLCCFSISMFICPRKCYCFCQSIKIINCAIQDVVPSSSCSLGRAGTVKDFKWLNHASAAYVVLSNGGLLSHGSLGKGLEDVMGNVDAVDCCKEGNHIAIARENKLTILSSDFKETCCMSLLFQLWSDESDSEGTTIKVDSIGWIRDDSIVIGCVRLNEDDNEEGYLVQVIRSEENTFCEVNWSSRCLLFSHRIHITCYVSLAKV